MNDKWTKRWSVKWIDDTQKTVKEEQFNAATLLGVIRKARKAGIHAVDITNIDFLQYVSAER